MKTLCCVCLGTITPGPEHPPSHGICEECFPDYLRRAGMSEDDIKQTLKELEVTENDKD